MDANEATVKRLRLTLKKIDAAVVQLEEDEFYGVAETARFLAEQLASLIVVETEALQ